MSLVSGSFFDDLPDGLPDVLEEERVETLAAASGVRIERIVSTGQSSPEDFWYDQERDEFVAVLRGAAGLEIEGRDEIVEMEPGAWTLIPARCRHRVAWTSPDEPTIWIAVYFPDA